MDVRFALLVRGTKSEWDLAVDQKRVNLRLFHSRSVLHRFVDFDSCQDNGEGLRSILGSLPIS
jgi:hypothetical protein